MGEAPQHQRGVQDGIIRPTLNRVVHIEAQRERLTADAVVILLR